ncbi:hypothetical protein [Streptococcus infantis]|nr:hypothetical protein [Streptococcus infantis]EIG40335.1 hypothetical protein HMPREF1111_1218 [Streptococcus infantis ATCC 700779]
MRQSMIMDDTFPFVKSKLVEWANTREMLLQIHLYSETTTSNPTE